MKIVSIMISVVYLKLQKKLEIPDGKYTPVSTASRREAI
uniref:Uncharacterized protein n=1 Tax=Pithovirus LCPAC404 TaxID=2506597 RepID=A0A481ZE52_9VIRU|nr:MAG: hypothetical protein LCPAC404_01040 [Pithovirus LCPAC404]